MKIHPTGSHFHNMMSKTNSRLYILKICKYYGHTLEEPSILFHSLIMSPFTNAIEVCAWAYGGKHLSKIDKFCEGVWKYVYTHDSKFIRDVIQVRDRQLSGKIQVLIVWNIFYQVNVRINHYVNVVIKIYYHALAQSSSSIVL